MWFLCKPGTVTPHKKFTGEVYVLLRKRAAVTLKRRTKTKPRLAAPSCHGRR